MINKKFYIGKHETDDINDGYIGSGILLKKAISKYGKENFIREILYVFDNAEEMNSMEKKIVNESLVTNKQCYNIATGGEGGNLGSEVSKLISKNTSMALKGKKKSESHKVALSDSKKGHLVTIETRKNISDGLRKILDPMTVEERKNKFGKIGTDNPFFGKSHTDKTKELIREAIGDSRKGNKNPRAKSITIGGITYSTYKECMESLNLNKRQFYKLLGEI
jgi:group I intron endonuclease